MGDRSSAVRWQSPLSQAFFHACVETQPHSRRSQSNPLRGERCGPTRVPAMMMMSLPKRERRWFVLERPRRDTNGGGETEVTERMGRS